MTRYSLQSISNIFLIAIFLLFICSPPLRTLFSSKVNVSKMEKRILASMPELEMKKESIEAFPSKFGAYYNDHFGFRSTLIYWHNYIKAMWLQISPADTIMLGKNGWLFYTPNSVIDDFQGKIPFTIKQLDQWKNYIENKRDWLAERGIRYLIVIVPNKHSIYPENIKDKYQKTGGTRIDQLTEYLSMHSEIEFLDLRGPLLKEKINDLVYFPTDLHLNAKGAFIAYSEIIRKISKWFPQEKVMDRSKINEFTKYTTDGELAVMLGLPECYPAPRHIIKLRLPCSVKKELLLESLPKKTFTETTTCESATLHGVVFMDSMGLRIMPFLSENFNRIHFIWSYFEYEAMEEILEKEHPDIVIEEVVERFFIDPFIEKVLERVLENLPTS